MPPKSPPTNDTQAAVKILKEYLSEEKYAIPLDEFLRDEAKRAKEAISSVLADVKNRPPDANSVFNLMQQLEAACEKLIHIFVTGSFYAKGWQADSFFRAFCTITAYTDDNFADSLWNNMKRYPALLLAYAAGVSAVISGNYIVLKEISYRPSLAQQSSSKLLPAPTCIDVDRMMERVDARKFIPGAEGKPTPFSSYLNNLPLLKDPLKALMPDESRFDLPFDEFEYLWSLLSFEAQAQIKVNPWPPHGAFIWRRMTLGLTGWLPKSAESLVGQVDVFRAALQGGLFGGDFKRLQTIYDNAGPILASTR